MKVAWIGGMSDGGGVPGMSRLLVEGLLDQGVEVDYYADDVGEVPKSVRGRDGFTHVVGENWWRWNRWYSRTPFRAFVSSTIARTQMHRRLCRMLIERHRTRPYDCVFQLSQTELFELGRHLDTLPPVVVHPCSHAAGELRWHRIESAYALQSERRLMHYAVRTFLRFRAWVQRRELRKPALVVGPSRRFVQLLAEDYGVEPERLAVLRHPVDLTRCGPPEPRPADGRALRLLFISRISVRKGFEQVVDLSKRLDDLAGQVEIHVIGDRTQWSDYTKHLGSLNPRVAKYIGQVPHESISETYRAADALLVPSMYEPGSLVVGEALRHGLPVLASTEVGPTEVLSPEICRTFPAGDIERLEAETRRLLTDLRADGTRLRRLAWEEVRSRFESRQVTGELLAILSELVERANCAGRTLVPSPSLG